MAGIKFNNGNLVGGVGKVKRFLNNMAFGTRLLFLALCLLSCPSFADETQPDPHISRQGNSPPRGGEAFSANSTLPNGHFSAIYLESNAINIYVDKTGNDRNNCTLDAKCLTINRALQVAPSIVQGQSVGINIFIGAGIYKENIILIGFPVTYGTPISFIGTFDSETGAPTTIIDNENTRDFAFQIRKGVQANLRNIKIINVKDGKNAITAVDHVYLYLENVHIRVASSKNTKTICVVANSHSHIYSKRSNIEGCDIGLEAVNSGVIHAGYSAIITGTHTEIGNSPSLTDISKNWMGGKLVGARINNTTDGSTCQITANKSNSVTCTLAGGGRNYWDNGDFYTIYDGADTYKNNTWTGLYYAENTSGRIDNSYFIGNNRAVELQYESRANFVNNVFMNNLIAISALHNSTIFEATGNTFNGNKANYDIETGSTYGSSSRTTHSVPCIISTDCSTETGLGYCCWDSTTNKLYFGNGKRAIEIGGGR